MSSNSPKPLIFSGSSHQKLTNSVAVEADLSVGKISIETFPDGEISVKILDSVRGLDVFVLQTIALKPNEYLMELLIIVDALKRASAKSIIAILPYYGYCRQDRKEHAREPITAKLVANLLEKAGVSHVITIDLHSPQVEGFFDIPVDNLYGRPTLVKAISELALDSLVVVAPDVGSVKLVRDYALQLNVDFVVLDKIRHTAHDVTVTNLIGDVEGKSVLLADDMCSTAGTLVSAAKACHEKGARKIIAAVTHGLFMKDAIERIKNSPIELVLHCDTISSSEWLNHTTDTFKEVSVAPLLAKAIRCILSAKSISSLFA